MRLFKNQQRLRERLVTNAVERHLLEEAARPFSDPSLPISVKMLSEYTHIDSSEIITVFKDYKVYGMQMLESGGEYFIRITN